MPESDSADQPTADDLGMVDPFKDDHHQVEVFHQSTKMTPHNLYDIGQRVGAIAGNPGILALTMRSWKSYSAARKIALPRHRLGEVTVEEAIRRRRSQIGPFAGGGITLGQMSAILRYSCGPTTKPPPSGVYPPDSMHLRAAPSGGGLHPSEVYAVVLEVTGLPSGIYHYDPRDHSLDELRVGPVKDDLAAALTDPQPAVTSAVTFVISSVMRRNLSKYLYRGYRFLSYDVGCLLQTFYLTTAALGLGATAVGGFYDDPMGELVGADNVDECVRLLFAVGQPTAGPLADRPQEPIGY